jgi:DNA-binding transcriptional regulator GbsR (MarR family)
MHDDLQAVRDSVINGLGQLTDFFGFSPVMGHLYGALLMSPTALSLDALEEIVGKSKASVSMNMRALERWGMVREVWVKGDRRKYYESEADLWKIVVSVLESRERREVEVALNVLDSNADQLREAKPDLSEDEQELAEYYLERVKEMQAFFRFAQMGIELLMNSSPPPDINEVAELYGQDPPDEEAAD